MSMISELAVSWLTYARPSCPKSAFSEEEEKKVLVEFLLYLLYSNNNQLNTQQMGIILHF